MLQFTLLATASFIVFSLTKTEIDIFEIVFKPDQLKDSRIYKWAI